jgi:pilus assembly protein CpaC
MSLQRKLPALVAAAFGLLLVGTNAQGIVEANAAGKSAHVTASTATQRVKLGLSKSVVIDLPSDAYDILVANPTVADAVTRTARRIYLFGKAVGETNIFVFGPNGEQIVSLDLSVERDVAGLDDYIKRFIPTSSIKVELLNDNVVLTGTVDTPLDAKRAVDLATIFVSGGEATTGQYSQTAAGGSAQGGVDINNPDSQRRVSKIVNLLQIIGDDQVTLKVTVAEVSRSVMKQLGVNMFGNGTSNGITWNAIGDNITGLGKPLSNSSLSVGTSAFQAYINAMEQSGVMKTLAEPTLTAVSGEKATFKVGGEYNIVSNQSVADADPTKGTPAKVTYGVDKIEYGIGLEFQPVVLSAGRISLKVRTSVSEPTTEASVGLSTGLKNALGASMLSIRKRLADTTVELPSGGSMMIAGLVRDDVRQAVSQFPGLGKIPVLGTLFRSRDFVRNESELVIIITPYLARPVARNVLAKPDDNFAPPSDGAGMFLGRVNRVYGTMQTDKPNGRYHGVVGFIYK